MPDKAGRFNDQEKVFVVTMATTGDPTYAAAKAGYASPQPRGSANMAKPAVAAAVRAAQQQLLYGPMRDSALQVVHAVMVDEKASNRDRLTAAKIVLDKTEAAPDDAAARDLSSMSADELARALDEARAKLETLRTISPVIDAEPTPPPRLPDPLPTETSVFG